MKWSLNQCSHGRLNTVCAVRPSIEKEMCCPWGITQCSGQEMEQLTWFCCDCLLRKWVCEYVCFYEMNDRITALIVSHVRLMRSTSPWAAICLSLFREAGQALPSDLEDKSLLDVERGLDNGKLKIRLGLGISVLQLFVLSDQFYRHSSSERDTR